MSIVSNTRVDIVARGVIKACLELGLRPGREDRDLPHPGRVGGGGLQDPRAATASSTPTAPCRCTRRRGARSRRSRGPRPMSILIDERHDVHRPGHHRPRGGQPHARVPRLRRRREDRRRRDARPPGPRRPRRAGVRHRRAGRRAPRRADRRLGRHGPARVHQGRRVRGDRERRQARRDRHRAHPAPRRRRRWSSSPTLRGARIIGPNCLGIIVPDVDQDGRHRRPGEGRGARPTRPGPIGVISPLGRHDDRDVLDAHRRRASASRPPSRSAATRSSARPTPS